MVFARKDAYRYKNTILQKRVTGGFAGTITGPVFLYPTQRVAEGIMVLTRPSVSQSVRQSCFSCQRNSSETAQKIS